MSDFTVARMQDMQRRLQERYRGNWEDICPENGKNKVLWMMGEVGEAIDIIKKRGHEQIMVDPDTRRDFVEELADVLMFYNDVMLCYDISPDELERVYEAKFRRNMERW